MKLGIVGHIYMQNKSIFIHNIVGINGQYDIEGKEEVSMYYNYIEGHRAEAPL